MHLRRVHGHVSLAPGTATIYYRGVHRLLNLYVHYGADAWHHLAVPYISKLPAYVVRPSRVLWAYGWAFAKPSHEQPSCCIHHGK